jgi:2-phosphoglycolate phosphatase
LTERPLDRVSLKGHDVKRPGLVPSVAAVVFDLDGTLIDSATDLIEAVRKSFRHHGLGELPTSYRPSTLSGTMDGVMADACQAQGWSAPEDFTPIKAQFVREYAAMGYPNAQLYPGVKDVLERLQHGGVRMGVCTNSESKNATELLEKLGIARYVQFVCGADTFGVQKPSPLPLLQTLSALEVAVNRSLYVGDSTVDAICAHRAGVRFVWHELGYGGEDPDGHPYLFKFQKWSQVDSILLASLK